MTDKNKKAEYQSGIKADEYLKNTKRKIEKIIEKIRLHSASKETIKEAKKIIETELNKSNKKIISNKINQVPLINKKNITLGRIFLIKSLNITGTVESKISQDEKVFLNVDGKRIKIHYSDLSNPPYKKPKQNNKLHSKFDISNISSNNIDLRGLNVEEAIEMLDKFIDSAFINNISYIKVLHGTGTGALQEGIHSYLKLHKNIKKYNFASLDSGGYGVTEITLK